jgi:hypothetical protein
MLDGAPPKDGQISSAGEKQQVTLKDGGICSALLQEAVRI